MCTPSGEPRLTFVRHADNAGDPRHERGETRGEHEGDAGCGGCRGDEGDDGYFWCSQVPPEPPLPHPRHLSHFRAPNGCGSHWSGPHYSRAPSPRNPHSARRVSDPTRKHSLAQLYRRASKAHPPSHLPNTHLLSSLVGVRPLRLQDGSWRGRRRSHRVHARGAH